jgi:hypothetical protein
MCRSIHPLHNYEPPTTEDEMRAAAIQYVRKISGTAKPSRTNQAAFDRAVEAVALATSDLLAGLVATTPPHNRTVERQKARAEWERRQSSQRTAAATAV